MQTKTFFLGLLALCCGLSSLSAQVVIGEDKTPESFSILELISGNDKGLRLPHLTQLQRDTLDGTKASSGGSANMIASAAAFAAEKTAKAMGLQIFNTTTKCVETWNGVKWIRQCDCGNQPCIPIVAIPPTQGGATWSVIKWVGAFWRDNQKGERIIASASTGAWTASVDDPTGTGSWLTLDNNGGYDHQLWTDYPDDAENYQLPPTRVTSISGTGDILFRIGATSVNPNIDASYDSGKKPRYATVNLNVGGTNYKIFCRQGHSADYVFSSADNINGGTGNGNPRNLARKFSPYNLTDAALSESTVNHKTAVNGGVFVDFPTKAGAFWQWGTDKSQTGYASYIRMAYHPTNPVNDPSLWHFDYSYNASCDTWDEFTGADRLETCPVGWRRPTVGDITSLHTTQPADGSELMQSLFYTTFDGSGSLTNSNNYRYFGYYADGYFDRRPVEDGLGQNFATKSAVSASTTNAAYIGLLFTHPTTKASLFVPGAGSRNANNGSLHDTGSYGYFFSSSAYNADYGWSLSFMSSVANQTFKYRPYGFTVRCVAE